MKTLSESIIGRRSSMRNNALHNILSQIDIRDGDVVVISGGDFFEIIKDPNIWKLTTCRAIWNNGGMLYSTTPGGQPNKHNYLYLEYYNENLEYFIANKYHDKSLDIVRIWRPKNINDARADVPDSWEMKRLKNAVRTGKYTEIFKR